MKAVTLDFPNSYTPESSRIKEILEECAVHTEDGKWVPQENLRKHVTAHSHIIEILAKIGARLGMEIHIGIREQRDFGTNGRPLRELVTVNEKTLQQLTGSDSGRAKFVDLIWIKGGKISSLFEIECTTSITSALERCSNIESESRIVVIPRDRSDDLTNKLTSKMFKTAFQADKWTFAYFEDLYDLDVKTIKERDVLKILKAA